MQERKNQTYWYNKAIQKVINFDDVVKENIKEHNPKWPQILDYPYRLLITWGSGFLGKNHYLI